MNAIPPTQATFRASYESGRGTLVWTTGVADLETPVAAFLKLAHGRPNSFLLESIEGGSARSRYSIIGMDPDLVWRCRAGRAEVNRHARSAPHAFVPDSRPALDSLRALIQEAQLDVPDHLPPMLGGLVGYLGYDMVRLMERLPDKNTDAIGLPEAILIRPTIFAVFDNVRDELTLAAPIYPQPGVSAQAAWDGAQAALAQADAALLRRDPGVSPDVLCKSLIEAARDLGASFWKIFRTIILPLSMPGVVVGAIFVSVMVLGEFATAAALSGRKTNLLGNIIVIQVGSLKWAFAAVAGVVLTALMGLVVAGLLRIVDLRREL
mgnify:CR=1 FL=1